MPKTTWNLELKSASAVRSARAYRRELQSLQGMLEQVDSASARLNATLGRMSSPALVQRRVRGEQAVAREARSTYQVHRVGHRRVSQDIGTQQKIRGAAERAQRQSASRAQTAQSRAAASSDRAWRAELRHVNQVAHAEISRDNRAQTARVRGYREHAALSRRDGREGVAMLSQVGGLFAGLAGIAASTVGLVTTLAASFAGVAFQLGRSVLQMIAFREGALMTLATLARTEGENPRPGETADQTSRRVRQQREQRAGADFNWAQDFARRTPLNMTQVVELQTQAAAAGYQGAQAREMTSAAADAGALHPNDPTAASRFLLQMGQLRNSATARSSDYRPAMMAAGVNESAARRRAAASQGITQRAGEADAAYQTRVDGARISGSAMHAAILAEQRAMLGGGASGSFAMSRSGGIGATLSNLDEGMQAFVTSISGLANGPGMLALRGVLTQVADTLAGATSNGKRLQALFASFIDGAAGAAAGLFGPGGFDGALTRVLDVAKEAWPVLREIVNAFGGTFLGQLRSQMGPLVAQMGDQGFVGTLRMMVPYAASFGDFLGRVVGLSIRFTIAASEMIAMLMQLGATFGVVFDLLLTPFRLGFEGIHAMFTGIGTAMTQGIVMGIRAGAGAVYTELGTMATGAVDTVKGWLGIHSPSRVFANEVGAPIAAGIAVGLDRGRGPLDAALGDLVPVPSVGGPLGARAGLGGAVFQFNITVPPGTPAEVGEGIAEAAFDKLLSMLEVPALAG